MNFSKNLVDLLFWKDIISGDESAFSSIFKSYYNPLFNFGKLYTSDKSLINDSIQDLFIDFWEKRKNLNPDVDVKSYIYGGFRNKLLKKINQKPFLKQFNDDQVKIGFELSYEDLEIEKETDKLKVLKLNKILNRLPPKQKEVIYLKFYKGLNNEQIADVLKINYQSVKNHVYRSILVLRENLKKEDCKN